MQQFVIGWMRTKPGKREEFMRRAKPVFAITQKEDGCLFYEAHPTSEDPDLIILVEGWQSKEQHLAHQQAPHHVGLGPTVVELCVEGRFEEIEAAKVVTQLPRFTS